MVSKQDSVEKYLDGDMQFAELKQRIGEEAAEAVHESERQLDEAEDLAEELSKL
jgi:hypothetical protein